MGRVNGATLAFGLALGLALGWFFFAGLWWTVQRVPTAQRPGALLLGSFLLRTAVTLAGFLALVRLGAWPLLAALVGFLAARTIVTRRRAVPLAAAREEGSDDPLT